MRHTTTPGRWLARAAGVLSAGAALYVLTQDAIRTGQWTTDDLLMPVLVVLTISASHLVGAALRARALLAALGFLVLALIGTSLIVYTSVGRQARIAETEDGAAAVVSSTVSSLKAEMAAIADKRGVTDELLTNARAAVAIACASGNGPKCKGAQATAEVYSAAVTGYDADTDKLRGKLAAAGPVPVTGAKAARMASVIAVFYADEKGVTEKLTRAFRLFEPFAYSLFWELGSLIALSYGFAHGRRATLETISGRQGRPEIEARQPLPEPPEVPPQGGPKGGNRIRKPLPANVVPFAGKHPVIAALEQSGGTVASNRELAAIMGVSPGESTKRVREVAGQLRLERSGKELRISLAAGRKSA
jgi:hypothetical protein